VFGSALKECAKQKTPARREVGLGVPIAGPGAQLLFAIEGNSRGATFPAASAVLSNLKLPTRNWTGNGWPSR
jgi:hypothetical protein